MSEIHYNTQGSIARLFNQLKGQQVRLTIVAISIIIYIGLSIWNPMYSAIVSAVLLHLDLLLPAVLPDGERRRNPHPSPAQADCAQAQPPAATLF